MEKDTKILAIESSCDETAAAVVVNGREVLSNIIASQIDIHTKFGGVVPRSSIKKTRRSYKCGGFRGYRKGRTYF